MVVTAARLTFASATMSRSVTSPKPRSRTAVQRAAENRRSGLIVAMAFALSSFRGSRRLNRNLEVVGANCRVRGCAAPRNDETVAFQHLYETIV